MGLSVIFPSNEQQTVKFVSIGILHVRSIGILHVRAYSRDKVGGLNFLEVRVCKINPKPQTPQ